MNVSDYPAIILAGGLGTRLRSVIEDLPKPMALVDGKPFLHYLFVYLSRQGIKEVVLSVGYKHESIKEYFGKQYEGIEIKYSVEDEPLGTGGAIKKACSLVNGLAFVLNGDTFFNIQLRDLMEAYSNEVSEIAIALKPMKHFDRYGTVEVDESQRVQEFREKKFLEEGLINGGVYVLNSGGAIQQMNATKFSFEKDILENHVSDYRFIGKTFNDYFIDIGIPEDYQRAQEDFKSLFP